jgi:hypothetical protein
MPWKRMLAYITGSVNEDLLRRIEYLLGVGREDGAILEGTPVFSEVRGNRAEVIGRYGRSDTFSHLPLGKNSTSSLVEELDGNLSQSLVDRTRGGTLALEQPISKRKRNDITCVRELSCWHFPDQQFPSDESGQLGRLPSITEFAFQMHRQVVTQSLDTTTRPVPRVFTSHARLHQLMLSVWVKFVKSQTDDCRFHATGSGGFHSRAARSSNDGYPLSRASSCLRASWQAPLLSSSAIGSN